MARAGWVTWLRGLYATDLDQGRQIDLDAVRGVAILLAMGWHFNRETGNQALNVLLWPGRAFGWAGVDLFFVLSGFLVGRLVLLEIDRTRRFDAVRFFKRRALRLWPTLYVFLVAMLLYEPWSNYFWQIGLHVQNYARTMVATHLWSLAVEEHFYLLLALLIPALARRKSSLALVIFLVAVLIFVLVLRTASAFGGVPAVLLQTQTHYRLDAMACGVLLSCLAVRYPETFSALASKKLGLALVVVSCASFLANVSKTSLLGSSLGFSVSYFGGATFLLLLYKSGVERFAPTVTRVLALLGRNSYAIYIWHVPVGRLVERGVSGIGLVAPDWLWLFQYGSAIVGGIVATKLMEQPIMALRNRWYPAANNEH